jgi:outer membrane protein assembly factor BamB
VVQVLLKHKANVNAKDTFYSSTPLTWAQMRSRWDVIQELVEAGAEGSAGLLTEAVKQGQTKVVQAILAKANVTQAAKDAALAAVPAKYPEIAEALKKAGAKVAAKPKPDPGKPAAVMTPEALKAYAGTYEGDEIAELVLVAKDGKLQVEAGGRAIMTLEPGAANTFKVVGRDELTITFDRQGEKVTGLTFKSATNSFKLRRSEPKPQVATPPKPESVEEKAVAVKTPLNWPSFRGPHASGVADTQFPPTTWDVKTGKNILWKTPIPGLGHSCPVVWGDRVFLTTAISGDPKATLKPGLYGDVDSVNDASVHSWHVYALDKRSGKILWDRTAATGVPKVKRHMKGSHANPTPATDGQHVIACFGSEGLYCYDCDGGLVWRRDLGTLDSGWFYDPDYQWGFGSSPILFQNLVIVQCDVGKNSFVAAYDVATGKPVWTTPREEIPSWGTPTIYQDKDHLQLITNATKFVRGYDPLTGKELWRLGRNAEITTPTPIWGLGLIFVTSGYRPIQPIYAVRPSARGDVTLKDKQESNAGVAWSKSKGGPYMPTPILYGDYLYTCSNDGLATCYEAKTGKQIYRERLRGKNGYTASPVAADGRLYFTSEAGDVAVVKAGPSFQILVKNQMDDVCMATPAISDGLIFFRTQHFLYGIGRRPADERTKINEELRQELLKMGKVDQEVRTEFLAWMKQQGKSDARALKNSDTPLARKLEEIDRKNTARMKEVVEKFGWPGKSLVGADGANTAWLLVQHADKDRDFQKKCLRLMKPLVARGEVTGQDVAYLTDRVLVGEKQKQLYGTQCTVTNGEVKFDPIEDEANVDKRRAEIGLQPLAEYKKLIEQLYKAGPKQQN